MNLTFHPVNCLWNDFGEWSNCTEACDGGTQTRVRTIKQEASYGGLVCSGYATESKNCNEQPCKRKCTLLNFSNDFRNSYQLKDLYQVRYKMKTVCLLERGCYQ